MSLPSLRDNATGKKALKFKIKNKAALLGLGKKS